MTRVFVDAVEPDRELAEVRAAFVARGYAIDRFGPDRWTVRLGAMAVELDAAGLARFASRAGIVLPAA